eukprot:scaffold377_cov563-Prasinococcus_capsulatus_cf.AAC.16
MRPPRKRSSPVGRTHRCPRANAAENLRQITPHYSSLGPMRRKIPVLKRSPPSGRQLGQAAARWAEKRPQLNEVPRLFRGALCGATSPRSTASKVAVTAAAVRCASSPKVRRFARRRPTDKFQIFARENECRREGGQRAAAPFV